MSVNKENKTKWRDNNDKENVAKQLNICNCDVSGSSRTVVDFGTYRRHAVGIAVSACRLEGTLPTRFRG